jgi:hypothetical protein
MTFAIDVFLKNRPLAGRMKLYLGAEISVFKLFMVG